MTALSSPAASARALCIALGAGLLLAGCDSIRTIFAGDAGAEQSDVAPTAVAALDGGRQTGDPVPTPGQREVEFPVVAESVADDFGPDASKFADAVVPVLAPASMSTDQASGFADSYRATPDGYFARMAMDSYDVVVNGTRAFAVAPESAGARPRDTSQVLFSETDTGASVTFNRFGADYSIEFVCRGAGETCVTEAQATELVERLVPIGGGGR